MFKTGEILALAGLVLLLFSKMGGRRMKRGQTSGARGPAGFLAYGDIVAFTLMLTGLVVIYLQK
jgi:hypothetical protein